MCPSKESLIGAQERVFPIEKRLMIYLFRRSFHSLILMRSRNGLNYSLIECSPFDFSGREVIDQGAVESKP